MLDSLTDTTLVTWATGPAAVAHRRGISPHLVPTRRAGAGRSPALVLLTNTMLAPPAVGPAPWRATADPAALSTRARDKATSANYYGLFYALHTAEVIGAHMTLIAPDNEFRISIEAMEENFDAAQSGVNQSIGEKINAVQNC